MTETSRTCGCGRAYTLKTLPEKCECGVKHFGNWARLNEKVKMAARGEGTVTTDRDGTKIVGSDFKPTSFDIVE